MGDLMKDTTTFSDLLTKYGNFFTPAMKIKVDNSEITTLKAGITNVSVVLELDEASSATFTIVNIYDLENSSILTDVSSKIQLGKSVSIELGYGSSLTSVFAGYISDLSTEFDDTPSITVTALDIRSLMRRNRRLGLQYTEKKYSEVAKKVLDTYKAVCSKQEIEATTDEIENIMQNGTDYDFLKTVIGPKAKREFIVFGDTVYFRENAKSKDAILTLERGKGLISFTCSAKYCNEDIKIYGHDVKKNEVLVVTKAAKTFTAISSIASPGTIYEKQEPDADDNTKATNILESEVNSRLKNVQSGSGTCIGLPELIPGRYIKIDKLDTSVNKKYYLIKVTHSFKGDGFTTDFDIGGWL